MHTHTYATKHTYMQIDFPDALDGKESACNAGDPGSIPGLGRYPGERNGYSLYNPLYIYTHTHTYTKFQLLVICKIHLTMLREKTRLSVAESDF